MLTNMYYYNYYKPYMLRTGESNSVPTKKSKIADTSSTVDNYKILLNKSLKTDIVRYVNDISTSVLGTKDTANRVVRDMEDLNKNSRLRNFDTAKGWIEDDLEEFVDSFSSAQSFLTSQNHSQNLRYYATEISDLIAYNQQNLSRLGISFDENQKLTFDKEKFNELDSAGLNYAIGENIDFFKNVNYQSLEILSEPLTEHMRFKNLGYYYNYKLGAMEEDTFKMIETGLIIDRAV